MQGLCVSWICTGGHVDEDIRSVWWCGLDDNVVLAGRAAEPT